MTAYTIGVDFGTNSVRAIVANCANGSTVGTVVFDYPSGDAGILGDYLEGLRESIRGALDDAGGESGFSPSAVIGLGVDTTGSTPIPVDARLRPLALDPSWEGNLAAQAKFENGVLEITLAKKEPEKPKEINVEIG